MNEMCVDVIAMPCNSIHVFYDILQELSQVKIINIVESSLKKVILNGGSKVGIISSDSSEKDKFYNKIAKNMGGRCFLC